MSALPAGPGAALLFFLSELTSCGPLTLAHARRAPRSCLSVLLLGICQENWAGTPFVLFHSALKLRSTGRPSKRGGGIYGPGAVIYPEPGVKDQFNTEWRVFPPVGTLLRLRRVLLRTGGPVPNATSSWFCQVRRGVRHRARSVTVVPRDTRLHRR